MDIKQGLKKIEQKFNEDPMTVIVIGTLAVGTVLGSAAKLIDASSASKGRKAYARQIDYKINHQR